MIQNTADESVSNDQSIDQRGSVEVINDGRTLSINDSMELHDHIVESNMLEPQAVSNFDFPPQPSSFPQRQNDPQIPQYSNLVDPSTDWQVSSIPSYVPQTMDVSSAYPLPSFSNVPLNNHLIPNTYNPMLMDFTGTAVDAATVFQTPPTSIHSPVCFNGTPEAYGEVQSNNSNRQINDDDEEEDEEEEREVEGWEERGENREANSDDTDDDDSGDGVQGSAERSEIYKRRYDVKGKKRCADDLPCPKGKLPVGSSSRARRSTMVLQNMESGLVGQVLGLVLSSESKVDVKIHSQE